MRLLALVIGHSLERERLKTERKKDRNKDRKTEIPHSSISIPTHTNSHSMFQQLTSSVRALLTSAMPSCRLANSASSSSSSDTCSWTPSMNPPWTTLFFSSLMRLRNASRSAYTHTHTHTHTQEHVCI